jgi:NAD(P)-dependent dehydrogenase (short-subunit alcohol dehydrogenase family)
VTVDAFLATGATVAAVSREASAALDGRRLDVPADVSDPGAARRAVETTVETFGRLDVLVNNAALDLAKPLIDTTPEEVRQIFAVNALGPVWMTQAAMAPLARTRGAIVNVTSRLAHIGVAEMSVYGASKGALRAFTRGAAIELAPLGIRVNAVAPGMIETPLFDEWLGQQDDGDRTRERVVERIPLGRMATPEDVAQAIVFLAGRGAAHITGATLPVDGGYTAA